MLSNIKLAIGIALLALTPVMAVHDWRKHAHLIGDGRLVETTAIVTHLRRNPGKGYSRKRYTVSYAFDDERGRSWKGRQRVPRDKGFKPSNKIKISYRPSQPTANAIYPGMLWTDVLISSALAISAVLLLIMGFVLFLRERPYRHMQHTLNKLRMEKLRKAQPLEGWPGNSATPEQRHARWTRSNQLRQELKREPRCAPPPAIPSPQIQNVPSLRIRIPSLRIRKKGEY